MSEPYTAGQMPERRNENDLEQALLENRVKALVATVALGMGFDKPDLGFVIHYQSPCVRSWPTTSRWAGPAEPLRVPTASC